MRHILDYSVALGGGAKAETFEATAIGSSAMASGYNSVAVGSNSSSVSASSVALGTEAVAGGYRFLTYSHE